MEGVISEDDEINKILWSSYNSALPSPQGAEFGGSGSSAKLFSSYYQYPQDSNHGSELIHYQKFHSTGNEQDTLNIKSYENSFASTFEGLNFHLNSQILDHRIPMSLSEISQTHSLTSGCSDIWHEGGFSKINIHDNWHTLHDSNRMNLGDPSLAFASTQILSQPDCSSAQQYQNQAYKGNEVQETSLDPLMHQYFKRTLSYDLLGGYDDSDLSAHFSNSCNISTHQNIWSMEKILGNGVFDRIQKQVVLDKNMTRSNRTKLLRNTETHGKAKNVPSNYSGWSMNLQVSNFVGRICVLAKDQLGCRFLQSRITEGCSEDTEKILAEIKGHIVELMTDPFGNYLIQLLITECNEEQRMDMLMEITSNPLVLMIVSCNTHGTRVVQKMIEKLKSHKHCSLIVLSLKPGILQLMKDTNGAHVAESCLTHLSLQNCEFIYSTAIKHCVELATDCQGYLLLKQCLNLSKGEHKQQLIAEIISNALFLSKDKFGNFVVQNVLDLKVHRVTDSMIEKLRDKFGDLSMQKFSSYVVQKCLEVARHDQLERIVYELISSPLLQVMKDKYGNFVIQTALTVSKGSVRANLEKAIRWHTASLQSSNYGKNILSKITRHSYIHGTSKHPLFAW